ncbi:MAG: hypothetical protein DWH91_17490 [Planctomycetota bacterium]|nr:MAG: hypothetical protein DWH91_17490 [Planctomycetota bacterium]
MTNPEPDPLSSLVNAEVGSTMDPIPEPLAQGERPSIWAVVKRLLLLAGVMALAGVVVGYWNQELGATGPHLVWMSATCCGLSASAALILVAVTVSTSWAFQGILGSILLRTFIPLAMGIIWVVIHAEWSTKKLIAVHVPLFLVSLTVETILVVDIVSTSSRFGTMLGKGRVSRKMHG